MTTSQTGTGTRGLSGTYFESCNCDTGCPCVFLSAPTEDECTALVGWHTDESHAERVQLDGLNVALAVDSPGHAAIGVFVLAEKRAPTSLPDSHVAAVVLVGWGAWTLLGAGI